MAQEHSGVDSELDLFARNVLDHRKTVQHGLHTHDLRRLAEHIRSTVLPQLQELAELKATMKSKTKGAPQA